MKTLFFARLSRLTVLSAAAFLLSACSPNTEYDSSKIHVQNMIGTVLTDKDGCMYIVSGAHYQEYKSAKGYIWNYELDFVKNSCKKNVSPTLG